MSNTIPALLKHKVKNIGASDRSKLIGSFESGSRSQLLAVTGASTQPSQVSSIKPCTWAWLIRLV